jgi:hypothetical protein
MRSIARALAPATLSLALLALLPSCGGDFKAALSRDGSAQFTVAVSVPAGVAKKLREFRASGGTADPNAPLFDPALIKVETAKREGMTIASISAPDSNSLAAVVRIANLKRTVDRELSPTGFATLTSKDGVTTLRVRITRDNASSVHRIVPGLDRELIDALAPPSLEGTPVTKDEYRLNLKAMFGSKNALAIETSKVTISFTAPSAIIASGGFPTGGINSATAVISIPMLDLMVLERPIEFWISWK